MPDTSQDTSAFASTLELIDALAQGQMVILMDDEDRENEGDLIMAADCITPEAINFMITHARGLVCLTLTREHCERLNLPLMTPHNGGAFSTNFTLSIEAAEGVTTGISAHDRAHTVKTAVRLDASAGDIVSPGHIFPLMAKDGGVLTRAGHTEAGCDLARLAGRVPAAVIVEIIKEDGSMARRDDLVAFAKTHNLKIGTIADLISHRIGSDKTIKEHSKQEVKTRFGNFVVHTFSEEGKKTIHSAWVKGDPSALDVMVRVHTLDVGKDIFLLESDGWSAHDALKTLSKEPNSVFVWIDNGVCTNTHPVTAPKTTKTTKEQDKPTTYCTIGTGAQILRHLGVTKMRILSSKARFNAISGFGLDITQYIDRD